MFQLTALAADASAAGSNAANGAGGSFSVISSILIWVAVIALMYFMMIRPQKKKQKEEQKMRENLRVGDEITTIGGICGRVVNIKEDTLIIETGADRNKMTIKKWAMQSCDTVHDGPADDDDDDDDID